VHLVLENILGDLDVFALGTANHLVTLVSNSLVIARAREPVADGQSLCVPLRLVLLVLLVFHFLGTFFQHILHVLENNVIEGSVINLTELVGAFRAQVNHKTATEIVLDLDQMASHLDSLSSNQIFRELSELLRVLECFSISLFEELSGIFFCGLLAELNGENVILDLMKQLCESSHVDRHFLLEMVSTVHALKNVFGYVKKVTKGVFDSDSVSSNLCNIEVGSLREPLLGLELLRVPESFSSSLDLFSSSSLLATFASTDSCAQDERGSVHKVLGDFSLCLGGAGFCEIRHVHGVA